MSSSKTYIRLGCTYYIQSGVCKSQILMFSGVLSLLRFCFFKSISNYWSLSQCKKEVAQVNLSFSWRVRRKKKKHKNPSITTPHTIFPIITFSHISFHYGIMTSHMVFRSWQWSPSSRMRSENLYPMLATITLYLFSVDWMGITVNYSSVFLQTSHQKL